MLRFAPLLLLIAAADPVQPHWQAHSHNDYEHPRPLLDALDRGFCSVEADIFLENGKLLVAHNKIDLKPERTLEKLYLDPLRARAKANGGRIYPGAPSLWLLIDVKTDAKTTYAALHEVLARYDDILTALKDDTIDKKAVNVVISGNTDREAILAQKKRFAAIDGRPRDFDSPESERAIPWISDRWGNHFKWTGDGPMPADERQKLHEFADRAKKRNRLLRFWAAPEKQSVWEELSRTKVCLINTDKLAELQNFLSTTTPK